MRRSLYCPNDWVVEIIDDEIYLYSPKRSLEADPERWQAVGTTINALGEKLDQWERWRESRGASTVESSLAPDRRVVAYEGRRLKARYPWWLWLVVPILFAYALFGLVMMAIDTGGVFGL